jgi:hypothetical protein
LFRTPALLTDFWFDEIYSYERFARNARSAAEILFATTFKHDNNHHLNTLVLYLLGEQEHWVVYRLPGMAAGLVAVAGAVLIGRRKSRLEGLLTGVLVSASYLLAVHSTEARGYPWLLASTAVGFLALDRFLDTQNRFALLGFWISMMAGLLAHPAILHFYLGALLWSGFRFRDRRRCMILLHAVPLVGIVLWLLLVTRGSVVGGGPDWTWNVVGDEAFAWTLGYPLATVPAIATGLGALGLVAWEARRLWRERSDEGLFYVGAILGPVALIAALSPPFLFPRYFLVSLFFLLILMGRSAAALAGTSRAGRWAAAAGVAAFLFGNGSHLAALARERQSNHVAAWQTMAGGPQPVTVASWSLDQWTEMPLRFYSSRLGFGNRVTYIRRTALSGRRPDAAPIDWVLEIAQPCTPPPAPRRPLTGSHEVYVLRKSFAVCGPSGMSWFLFARETR